MRRNSFTLVEVLIAVSIFTIIMAMVLASVAGMFNSLRQAQRVITKEQKERFFSLRLSREVSSFTRVVYPEMRFNGEANKFFFVFAREDTLVESGYACNAVDNTLEHYSQEPADYDWSTYGNKEVNLDNLAGCKFSYSDGQNWQDTWDQNKAQFPRAIKVNFKFKDDDHERELIVNIPVSQ